MEEIRKAHNMQKRLLIEETTPTGKCVLDVGCGFGGDLMKWKNVGITNITMCDPSEQALNEAKRRSNDMKIKPKFFLGDINDCPNRKFDIICYNFSIQYIFSSEELFHKTIKSISTKINKNGKLIGIIPDSDMILMKTPYKDELGNFFQRNFERTGNGTIGEKVWVCLSDTPYYSDGPISEPIGYKDILINELNKYGFQLIKWEMLKTGFELSKMYSKFIFEYIK